MSDFIQLVKALEQAEEAYESAEATEASYRRKATDARASLNAAQKAIDEWLADRKAAAPWDTEWWNQKKGRAEARNRVVTP
jgi:hypothetical protein